jgi:fumarate reductase subunit D
VYVSASFCALHEGFILIIFAFVLPTWIGMHRLHRMHYAMFSNVVA